MPRRVFQVYATNEADARDMAERRARDARLRVLVVDEVIELEPQKLGLRPFVVWLSVSDR
jgi:hypothetical protein